MIEAIISTLILTSIVAVTGIFSRGVGNQLLGQGKPLWQYRSIFYLMTGSAIFVAQLIFGG